MVDSTPPAPRVRLTRRDRSRINQMAWQAAARFEMQERERLQQLPHLSKKDANQKAHAAARLFYVEHRQSLLEGL